MQLSQAQYLFKLSENTTSLVRNLRRPNWACLDRIPVRKMHAELRRHSASTEPLTFQGLSNNRPSVCSKLGREFGSILENQEIVVCAPRLIGETLNDHSNALPTTYACGRETIATGTTPQFMK